MSCLQTRGKLKPANTSPITVNPGGILFRSKKNAVPTSISQGRRAEELGDPRERGKGKRVQKIQKVCIFRCPGVAPVQGVLSYITEGSKEDRVKITVWKMKATSKAPRNEPNKARHKPGDGYNLKIDLVQVPKGFGLLAGTGRWDGSGGVRQTHEVGHRTWNQPNKTSTWSSWVRTARYKRLTMILW